MNIEPSKELQDIINDELKHFPFKRTLNYLITFAFLFSTSWALTNIDKHVNSVTAYSLVIIFTLYTIYMTFKNAKLIKNIHVIK
jgi:hypothetical protein